jgi:hypothetical protein
MQPAILIALSESGLLLTLPTTHVGYILATNSMQNMTDSQLLELTTRRESPVEYAGAMQAVQ